MGLKGGLPTAAMHGAEDPSNKKKSRRLPPGVETDSPRGSTAGGGWWLDHKT